MTRLGDIAFLNCHPIRWGLARLGARYPLRSDTPPRLGEALLGRRLDVSPVSLVHALRHRDRLVVLPGLAIGSDGPVRSCVLAGRVPPYELDGRPVALTRVSRTSVLLARMFLEDVAGVRPVYVPPDADADARVLIGDEALRCTLRTPPGWAVHDLGQVWHEWTGLPMVFAVWAARREFAAANPAAVADVRRTLTAAITLARAHPREVAASAAPGSGLRPDELAAYFGGLDFSLGERQTAAIRVFSRLAGARTARAERFAELTIDARGLEEGLLK
ncbi:menaquinone biosynthetic enzyme MqnA/MqnD family protein [Acrocarpospora catenulata]|uniref:menaquinone biosynthetic enzyme MqnA/MqnD family protein n=1 Tax=Acrocarpospora catenulata TaxID=2836182 RepID=UPI001BDAB73B|nr:menaquinone biosynthesis protein [Acrocarpospora catenulata]